MSDVPITTVMPLYNKRTEVRRAIQSVLTQTRSPQEFIVVDDGSTDGSRAVVEKWGGGRVRLLGQANSGESAARNRGVAEARHDLLAFCDADDEWSPEFLAEVAKLYEAFPRCDVFATGYVLREPGPNGRARRPVRRGLPDGDSWTGVLTDYFGIAARSDPLFCASSVAVRRDALNAVGGFPVDVEIGGDLLTWARLAARFEIAYSAAPCAHIWLRGPFGAPAGGRPKRNPDEGDPVGTSLASLIPTVVPQQRPGLRRFLSTWHRMRAEMFLRLDRRADAFREIRAMIRQTPTAPAAYVFAALALMPRRARRHLMSVLAYAIRIQRRGRSAS